MQINFKPIKLLTGFVGSVALATATTLPVTAKAIEKTIVHQTEETPTEVVTCYIRREVGNGAKILADATQQMIVDSSDGKSLRTSLQKAKTACETIMKGRQKTHGFLTLPYEPGEKNMPEVVNFKRPPFEVQQRLAITPTWLSPTAKKPVAQNLTLPPLKFESPTSLTEQQPPTGTKKPKTILPEHLFAYINLQKEAQPITEGYQLKNNEGAVVCYTESSLAKQQDTEGTLVPRKVLRITPEMAKLPETQLAKVAPLNKLLQDCYKAAPVGAVVLGTTVGIPAVIPNRLNPYTNDGSEINVLSNNFRNYKTPLHYPKNP
jgi:hypothetical protein